MEKTKRELDIHADGYRKGYKAAIEKACEWICKDCDRCVADANRIAKCPRLGMFRKAMEE